MSRILVTGGNGFVGKHLCSILNNNGINLSSLDIDHTGKADYPRIKLDLEDYNGLRELIDGVDGVIHLGGISRVSVANKDPLKCVNSNVLGSANVFESIRLSKANPWIIFSSTNESPGNIYGLTKNFAEDLLGIYSSRYGIRTLTFKFATIYGSNDNPGKVIPTFIRKAKLNEPISITNGSILNDFIYVGDIVNGIVTGINKLERMSEPENLSIPLCTGVLTSLEELVRSIIKQTNSSSIVNVLSNKKERFEAPNISPARELLGFRAKVNLTEGLRYII